MTVEGDVVVIEHMRSDPVDERRIRDPAAFAPRNEGRTVSYRGAGERPIHQADDRLARAGHHHSVAIGKAGLGDGPRSLGGGIEVEMRDKASDIRSQMSHLRSPPRLS